MNFLYGKLDRFSVSRHHRHHPNPTQRNCCPLRSADHIVCSGQHQRIVALLNKVGEHPRMADFLSSERRKPVPSRTFVNNVCEIQDIPVPKWASVSQGAAVPKLLHCAITT